MLLNRVKIIATVGPASQSEERLLALVEAGMNVARLNMSHGAWDDHAVVIQRLRALSQKLDRPIGILADLQGPKIRTGPLENGTPLPLGPEQRVLLEASTRAGHPARQEGATLVTTPFSPLLEALKPGDILLLDDGKIRLEAESRHDLHHFWCRVTRPGLLLERKGINVPHTLLPVSALTDKDQADLAHCVAAGVDFIALSFVQRAEDIVTLRRRMDELAQEMGQTVQPAIIAKIEKPQALQEIDAIVAEADGLMVARGDLGVEISIEEVPIVQKEVVEKANLARKPIVIATQMLESMILAPVPTRAEVSDVANGVYDGADALMLSAETAIGQFAVEAVATMRRTIEAAEARWTSFRRWPQDARAGDLPSPTIYHAVAHAASYAMMRADAKAIVVFSTSGTMAQRLSKLKPGKPIMALTPDTHVYQRLSLLWGVVPLLVPFEETIEATLARAEAAILQRGLIHPGDRVVFCAGRTPLYGITNMLRIAEIQEMDLDRLP
jgi:pyruvate kinase